MTRILSFDRLREDDWQRFGDERVEVANALLAPVDLIRERGEALVARGLRLAVDVDGAVAPEEYADILGRVDMVRIGFERFADGRGFSSARELRERFAFVGTIRAAGNFIPDQMQALARVGFDEWELPNDGRESQYEREIRRFEQAYQRLPGDRRLGLGYRNRSARFSI